MERIMSDFKKANDFVVRSIDGDTDYVKIGSRQYHVSVGSMYEPDDPECEPIPDAAVRFIGIDIDSSDITTHSGGDIESDSEKKAVAEKVAEFYRNQGLVVRVR